VFSRKGVDGQKGKSEGGGEEEKEEEEEEEEDWLLQADLVQSLRVRMDELFSSLGYGEGRKGGREGEVDGKKGVTTLQGAYLLYNDLPSLFSSSLSSSSSSSSHRASSSSSWTAEEEVVERRRRAMRELPALRAHASHVPLASLLRRVRESFPE